jgi:effector-binding domain-containing protein
MISELKTEDHEEVYYVSIGCRLKQNEIPELLPPLIPELFNWLNKRDIEPSGPPFFNYVQMDGDEMSVEVGIPVSSPAAGNGRIRAGVFPAGRYIVATYTGPYDNLPQVHSELAEWKDKNKLRVSGVTEFYPTDPSAEPDPNKWKTIIMSRIDEDQDDIKQINLKGAPDV